MNTLIAMIKATGKSLENMDELLTYELNELWSAEHQVLDLLPKLVDGFRSPEVQAILKEYCHEAKLQRDRLQVAFHTLRKEPGSQTSSGMKGLVDDASVLLQASGHPDVKDAALLAAIQQIHHYKMAAYGSARTFAREMGRQDVADLLQQTLDDEGHADRRLSDIAVGRVNVQAAGAH